MKKLLLYPLALLAILSSCMPDGVKETMNDQMAVAQKMMADGEFKKALGHIELHKLRNGSYPNSLSELQYLGIMDSSIFNFVEYKKLDSVYELNLKFEFPSMDGKDTKSVNLQYPAEFWKGLGCVKSNTKI